MNRRASAFLIALLALAIPALASATLRISSTVTDGTSSLSGAGSETGSTVVSVDESFASGSVRDAVSISYTVANVQAFFIVSDQDATLYTNGTNEVQRITITGTPAGGTFTITYSGQTTSAIAYNATASAVQTALWALSNVADGDVSVSGGPLPGTPVDVTFQANLGLANVAAMTTTDSFTGGSSPASAVSTTTGGVGPDNTFSLKAGREFTWRKSDGYFANPFTVNVTQWSVTAATAARLRARVLTN